MTEWRERNLAVYDNAERYNYVDSEKTLQLVDCLDFILEHYAKDAVEDGWQRYENHDKGQSLHHMDLSYRDVSFNAFQEAVITNTHVSLEHSRSEESAIRAAYEVVIERSVAVERRITQSTDPVFSDETAKSDRALVEYYTIEKLAGGEYRAYVAQLHDISSMSKIEYVDMTLYDLSSLIGELDKIADLYASYNRERAIIEK